MKMQFGHRANPPRPSPARALLTRRSATPSIDALFGNSADGIDYVKFGIFDHMDSAGPPVGQQFADRLTLIEAYDRLGFYAYHVAEHHGTPLGLAPSPGIFLAAVAARTQRLRFGPLVYTLPLYHPLRLIDEICMLDQLSGGRLELGVGRGVSPIEVGFFGVDPEAGPRQFPEALRVVLAGLAADRLTFHGEFYHFDDVPIVLSPVQKPHPPLWYGLVRPDTTHWAAKEGANMVTFAPTQPARALIERFRSEWAGFAHPADAQPLIGIQRHVVLAPTEAEALETAERAYRRWLAHMRWLWDRHGLAFSLPLPAGIGPLLDSGGAFAGTAEAFREFVAAEIAATGANYFVCDIAFGDQSIDEAMQTTGIIGTEVLPAFSD
jgi:alkanesulfonate monooxygenase SsuD/methylene tetrahydromethanopterin reductase-like flavin-dependent oxidoreductase (luciferase family)